MHLLLRSARRGLPACAAALTAAAILAGCASPAEAPPLPRRVTLLAVTDAHELIRVDAARPQQVLERKPLAGLAPGDELLGIDFRVARGVLYALGRSGRLYTVDVASGRLTPVGAAPIATKLAAGRYGFDVNPAADRLRVVGDDGQNLRLHPDTGALAATDPPLAYAEGDPQAGARPAVAAAAYTYNKRDDKLTTNFAIDRRAGTLVLQGSREGVPPAVSPNTGVLRTVGPLGTGALADASFDIADVDNLAFAALRADGETTTRLHLVDLASGRATPLGRIADGGRLRGLAIEP